MRVTILSVGHKMPAWIHEGYREYTKRMPPEIRVELVELKPGADIVAAIPKGGTVIALDERGRSVTSQGLSVMLSHWMREGSHPVFVIGAAEGLDDAVKERADKMISLSPLTFPHALVRVVLAEQLYSAWSSLARHTYHRE